MSEGYFHAGGIKAGLKGCPSCSYKAERPEKKPCKSCAQTIDWDSWTPIGVARIKHERKGYKPKATELCLRCRKPLRFFRGTWRHRHNNMETCCEQGKNDMDYAQPAVGVAIVKREHS